MKRVILCVIILAALCALAAGSYFYIVDTTTRLLNKVELVGRSFAEGDYQTALGTAEDAYEIWSNFRKNRYLIIDRDNVAEITASLARIKSLANARSEEVVTECSVAAALLDQYTEKQKPNGYNVFSHLPKSR